MLKIVVQPDGPSKLDLSLFERLDIAAPGNGVEAEADDDLVLRFEDEEDAIEYADMLQVLSDQLNDKTTTQYLAINDIIAAIRNDRFVQDFTKGE